MFVKFGLEKQVTRKFYFTQIFFLQEHRVDFLEGASRSPENCLADPKRTADPSLRTSAIVDALQGENRPLQLQRP